MLGEDMTVRIQDLVSLDISGDFRSDVQLSDADDINLNKELLRSYIFTVDAPKAYGAHQISLSARDVLETLKTIFTVDREENRVVLTANYGHGKSHLALVLANFFGCPVGSVEVETILDRLGQALNNQSLLSGYRDFKKTKGEFLVVRLQGDRIADLHEGFIIALEQALREHDATKNIIIPFWYCKAREWMENLQYEEIQRANNFLRNHNTDIAMIKENIHGKYDLVREMVKYLKGIYPDFGRDVSLEEMIVWAVDEICKTNQMGGLLVIFDEFSLFLRKYITSGKIGTLQDLLNGISKRRGKSAFLAFTQQDIDTIATTYSHGQRSEDVKKELERLPKDRRFRLYSLMESVLGAYFKLIEDEWERCFKNRTGLLVQARETTIKHFSKRYYDELRWNINEIHEKIVKGCFPLHPLTTAILSVHTFEAGTSENPRTSLQFVRRVWKDWAEKRVYLENGDLNFVFPVTLVDFFGEQISKKWYTAYRRAIETAPQSLSEEHRKILQALLVQQAVDLKAKGDDQINLIHHLCGVRREIIRNVLSELQEQKVIHYNPISKVYALWPESVHPQEVEKIIQKAINRTPVDKSLMGQITENIPPMELSSLNFGHASDWSPQQIALTVGMFTSDRLKTMLQPYRIGTNGIEEGQRGFVIWLIAQTEDEMLRIKQNAQSILNEVIGSARHPLPVVVVLPKQIGADVIHTARRRKALDSLDHSEREQIGMDMYRQEKAQTESEFKRLLEGVFGRGQYADIRRNFSDYALPDVYRAAVQALQDHSLKNVVTECYRLAYAHRPEFYTQYPVTGKGLNKLRDATRKVTYWLFNNDARNGIRSLTNKDIEYQLATQYLTQKWGILNTDHCIQEPTSNKLRNAWDRLNNFFPPGCQDRPLKSALNEMLNPPYGHDYNTLTLLIVSWMNFYQYELRLTWSGRLISLNELQNHFKDAKNPQEFLNKICTSPLLIDRIKADEVIKQVSHILDQIKQGTLFTQLQARNALAVIDQVLSNPILPENERKRIQDEHSRLKEALEQVENYDKKVDEWLDHIQNIGLNDLIKAESELNHLPKLTIVTSNQPDRAELERRWYRLVEEKIKTFCDKHSRLNDLTDYGQQKDQLERARKKIERFPKLVESIDGALRSLKDHYDQLKKQEDEKSIVAEIRSMTTSTALATLREYQKRLVSWTDLSNQTEKLRQEKLEQITTRIQQYERLAKELPDAIERANELHIVDRIRDQLISNLENFQDTEFYKPLAELRDRIEKIKGFFTALHDVDRTIKTAQSPEYLDSCLEILKTHETIWLGIAQKELLQETRRKVNAIRTEKKIEAQNWLKDIEQRSSNSKRFEELEELFQQLESPPPFLPPEERARVAQIRRQLQQQINQNVISQIEMLFKRITDPNLRQQCLRRLQELAVD